MIILFCSTKKSGVYDEAKETNGLKDEGKSAGKSPKKPRRPVKRFGEMSEEDVLKLKLPEHLDYNLDILFVSILMFLIWQSWASEKKKKKEADQKHFQFTTRESLTLIFLD